MRILFIIISLLHGLIHIMGYLKEFHIAHIKQITGPNLIQVNDTGRRILGSLWLLATILFLATAAAFMVNSPWLLWLGLAAVVVSQMLLVLYWTDAKFGTIANLYILIYLLIFYFQH